MREADFQMQAAVPTQSVGGGGAGDQSEEAEITTGDSFSGETARSSSTCLSNCSYSSAWTVMMESLRAALPIELHRSDMTRAEIVEQVISCLNDYALSNRKIKELEEEVANLKSQMVSQEQEGGGEKVCRTGQFEH